jgi:tRNA dimethylallyltransferase
VNETAPIAILCGPTASGKTGVAVSLAESFPLEVISADSRQMIRHLDIGTAKPTDEERSLVPMHLVDVIEPGERYSAFRFIDDSERLIGDILTRGNLPLLVGGTGLYLHALSNGVVEIEEPDMKIRDRLEAEMEEKGAEFMWEQLQKVDPLEAAKVHPNNKVRVIRGLEIFYLTGTCKSELVVTGAYRKTKYQFKYFCLAPARSELCEIIDRRVDEMIVAGLVDEVRGLVDRGISDNVRRAGVIGYDEILDYLDNMISLDEAIALIKQNTRRYAKRQMTWFRRQDNMSFYADRESILTDLRFWAKEVANGTEKT